MNNIVEAEFQALQERTLPVIASEIILIERQVANTALEGAIQIGFRLREAKEQVEHGNWENWCAENLNYSKRKAERFMKIATEYGDENSLYAKTSTLSDLSISKALSLLQVPDEQVENFVKENDVESMTVKELNEKIKALESEKEISRTERNVLVDEYEKRITAADDALEQIKGELEELRNAPNDQETINELEEKLREAEMARTNLREQLTKELDSREKEIKKAVDIEAKRAKEKEARIRAEEQGKAFDKVNEANKKCANAEKRCDEAESEKADLEIKISELKKKLENQNDESVLLFKLKCDQLQDVFIDCVNAAAEAGESKFKTALKALLQSMIEEMEE